MKIGRLKFFRHSTRFGYTNVGFTLMHTGRYGTNWTLEYSRQGVNGVTREIRFSRNIYSNGLDLSDNEAKEFASQAVSELFT